METLICLPGAIIVLALFIMSSQSIKNVSEYQRLVIFRLGRRLDKVLGPGWVFTIPVLDRGVKVDLREQVRESLNNNATTRDFKAISFSFSWYFKVVDPLEAVMGLNVFESPATEHGATRIRMLILDINSTDLSSERRRLEQLVAAEMNDVASRLGLKVTNVEITKIENHLQ